MPPQDVQEPLICQPNLIASLIAKELGAAYIAVYHTVNYTAFW